MKSFNITAEMLNAKGACACGMRDFLKRFPKEDYTNGADYQEILNACADAKRPDYANWLLNTFGATDTVYEADEIDTNGCFFFAGSVHVKKGIKCHSIKAGGGINAGWGIKAGWDIEAGEGIKAGLGINAECGIKAGLDINAGLGINAGCDIKAGWDINAGCGIKAGCGIEAGEGINAGWGIEAGLGINAGDDYGIYAGLSVRLSKMKEYATIKAKEKPENIVCGYWHKEGKKRMKSLNDWAKEIHENAIKHGWWEEERCFPEIVALCHSELSEALEEYRCGNPLEWKRCICNGLCTHEENGACKSDIPICEETPKPEGIAVEMADCIIRILDWCGKEGIDIERIIAEKHEYNKTRPYKHGKRC